METKRSNKSEISSKPKYFITFPYPYMNGKLHLGHLYSLSKADFMAYYKEIQGYNVLFPLSFHCTGMPISALAKKLEEELNGNKTDISTKDIIESLGFDDVRPFTDPLHWVRTFPKYCREALETFGANIDWRRSFITTDLNKYYDSFIRWQFNNLKRKGYLSFGKRYSIYCPIDNQACLDHDRRKGENIKPFRLILYKLDVDKVIILVRYKSKKNPTKLICGKNIFLTKFRYNGTEYLSEDVVYENMKYQVRNLEYIEKVKISSILPDHLVFDNQSIKIEIVENDLFLMKTELSEDVVEDKFKEEISLLNQIEQQQTSINSEGVEKLNISENKILGKLIQTDNFVSAYIPEEEVISRSGGVCVVSLLDQWYIDYSNQDWKEKVKKCLGEMECEQDTRSKLLDGVDWIYKWGFSRSFGLGTRIPWDQQYLIDSLSDSTIYMALYTFKHFLFEDLEGKKEIFPTEKLSTDVWDYIFYGKELAEDLKEYSEILENCRKSFEYFYPVDLRVSGKDLIKNHLLFFLFNHVAMFDKKYWPRRIFTNGHLMLNSEKMSKSTGNFLTVDKALEKFGMSATRICLAVCGDTNEDANFVESNANSYILKLYSFVKNIEELSETVSESENVNDGPFTNADIFLIESLSYNIRECINAYDNMRYSDVVKYGFFEMTRLVNLYKGLRGKNNKLIRSIYKSTTQLLYPIIPCLGRTLIEKYYDGDFSLPTQKLRSDTMIVAFEYLRELSKKIFTNKSSKNKAKAIITVGNSYPEWKIETMKYIDTLDLPRNEEIKKDKQSVSMILNNVMPILKKYEINVKKGNLFVMDFVVYPTKYIKKFNEYDIINEFKFYIEDNTGKSIEVKDGGSAEPLNPIINYE
jgi:leucyl-tRNA synthetase